MVPWSLILDVVAITSSSWADIGRTSSLPGSWLSSILLYVVKQLSIINVEFWLAALREESD